MKTEARPLGVLLAGGLARRMGGGDKPMRLVRGRTILDRVIERFAPQCDGLVLNANGDAERFSSFGLPVVADGVPDFAGPLAGILAALEWASIHRPDVVTVASVSTDSPFIPLDLVERLEEARKAAGLPLACAATDGRTHPPIGLWPVALRHDLRHALMVDEERKIDRWTSRHGCIAVDWHAVPHDPFFNANAPEDLDHAERICSLIETT
jgi:molybdopterin-guanine dinucleotide biosynthesis protein A